MIVNYSDIFSVCCGNPSYNSLYGSSCFYIASVVKYIFLDFRFMRIIIKTYCFMFAENKK